MNIQSSKDIEITILKNEIDILRRFVAEANPDLAWGKYHKAALKEKEDNLKWMEN